MQRIIKSAVMKTVIFLAIFFTILPFGHGLNTKIEGQAPGAENLKIRFYIWDDFITFKENLLLQSEIDDKGHFSFEINLHPKEVLTGFFRIMNFQSPKIFIEAGKDYKLAIDTFDYKDPNRIYIPHLSNIKLNYSLVDEDSSDINALIKAFNIEFNTFFEKELNIIPGVRQIARRLPKSMIDSFEIAMNEKFKYADNTFFRNYMKYTIAEMHLGFRTCGMEYIYRMYLYRQPILYDNIQYMTFFSQFFQDFIFTLSKNIPKIAIIKNINHYPNVNHILDTLGRDTLLKNELIREAVLLLNMRDWYTNPYINKKNLLKLMQDYINITKFDLQARIAKNLIFMLTRFQKGNPMPEFRFKKLDGNIFCNDSLKDKPTYIMFFTTWSKSCLSELQVMNKIKELWGDSIRFIAVSMDQEPLKLYYFLNEHKFSFPVFHYDNDYILEEELSLTSFPHCMLIDEEGKYIMHTAPLPSEGIHDYFQKNYASPEEKKTNTRN